MISKSQIKLITSLGQKKNRAKFGLFNVEGKKGIQEILKSDFELENLFTTEEIFNTPKGKTFLINKAELKKISGLTTPQVALATFKIPNTKLSAIEDLTVVLDGVRDPGNLGTIIRLCDWFGIENIICSQDTVDCFNPKVVQATMGSITRVMVHYLELHEFLSGLKDIPVLGTYMDGDNIYKMKLPQTGFVIFGNEANGISSSVQELVKKKIKIPQFGTGTETESLNVATATAIVLSEFRRQNFY